MSDAVGGGGMEGVPSTGVYGTNSQVMIEVKRKNERMRRKKQEMTWMPEPNPRPQTLDPKP